MSESAFVASLDLTWSWAAARDFAGYDPYDALRSPFLDLLHRVIGRPFGIASTQFLRRAPVNVRPVLGISPTANAKGLGLFLSAAARTGRIAAVVSLSERLRAMQSPGWDTPCWGYPFPWRARAFYLPAHTPTVVATSFVGEAFLDAFVVTRDANDLNMALGACRFVLERLHRTEDTTGACLSYSPLDRSIVYNASVLAARLLVRTGLASGRQALISQAEPLIRFVLARQHENGSWAYGEASFHRWIDSFHTGFVLSALDVFARATGDEATSRAVVAGAKFYAARFFGPRGEPYYSTRGRYPYDVHAAAQGAITFVQLDDFDPSFAQLAERVGQFLVDEFVSPDGHFRYQIRRTHRVSIPYMRWSQAWGVRALAALVENRVATISSSDGRP